MINLKKAAVRWNLDHYIPKKVHGFLSESMDGTPRQAAALFLKENHESLKISTVRRDLRYDTTVESLGGYTVLFSSISKEHRFTGPGWRCTSIARIACF